MKKILFVCTGNTCRSPMAQGLFNHICAENNLPFAAESAGLSTITGLPVAENSKKAMAKKGIDISSLTSTDIADKRLEDYCIIAVMTSEHRDILRYYGVPVDSIYILSEDKGGIFDPYGGSEALYELCENEIEEAVKTLITKLRGEL
ncbi:MAG: low molecular weight protein arginine phosphatase [Ruminococcus sp.]|nr:low molecular weight protein arginine phosphatase [Ruminococcus sp.]